MGLRTLTSRFFIVSFLLFSLDGYSFIPGDYNNGIVDSSAGLQSQIKIPEDGLTFKAGMAISEFSVKGNNEVHVVDIENDKYVSPVVGIGYLATTKWFSHRLFYLVQLKIYEFENTGTITANYSYSFDKIISDYDTFYYHAAAQYVLLPSLNIGYKVINHPNSKLLLSGGVSTYIMKNPYFIHNPESWANQLNQVVYTGNFSVDYYFSDWVILWGMYNLSATIDKEDYFVGSHSDLQFGVGVRF